MEIKFKSGTSASDLGVVLFIPHVIVQFAFMVHSAGNRDCTTLPDSDAQQKKAHDQQGTSANQHLRSVLAPQERADHRQSEAAAFADLNISA
jgi:hypothetical protein